MKSQKKTKKQKFIAIIVLIIFAIFVIRKTKSFGIQNYYKLDFVTGLVTATNLNIRSGPGLEYKVISTAKKNEYIRVFAGIGDWYVVQTNDNYIGVANKKYIKAIYPSNADNSNNNSSTGTSDLSTMNEDEKEVFNLINKERNKNGLNSLKVNEEVQKVARIKAQDMVNNGYFSHQSPIYGSPFDMLKSFKITYKTAGENIAGNSNNTSAVTAWMNSEGHRANILNSSFTYTGIGVVKGSKYGKIYVQMFIGY